MPDIVLDMAVLVESFGDVAPEPGFAAELTPVAGACLERRGEYSTVRACARRALRMLGRGPAAILTDPEGVPVWPHGVVGSMTHCPGYRAAVVAHSHDQRALGLDAEPHEPLPGDVIDLVLRPEERRQLASFSTERRGLHGDRIMFSAKETAYKAWFPTTRRFLDYSDIGIELCAGGGFVADSPEGSVRGRWVIRRGFVVTLAGLDRRDVAPC
jgi:4'-phosphopantetheinyl transferase EntD